MYGRTIKKALGLLVVDALLIIGIFVLQFRNDSIITEKWRSLQVTLSETTDSYNNLMLKNKMSLAINGITFSCSDEKPAFIVRKHSNVKEPVALTNWNKTSESSFELYFTENVTLAVELRSTEEIDNLFMHVSLPEDVDQFFVPYAFATNTEIKNTTLSSLLVTNKKADWELSAPLLEDQYVCMTSTHSTASYAYFENTKAFTFDSITELAIQNFDSSIAAFKENLITSFKSNTSDALTNEQAVVSYVAAMAQNGKYQRALDDVPSGFRHSKQRTFLSAPFFNSLSDMNNTLEAEISRRNEVIKNAGSTGSFQAFTEKNMAAFMYIYPNTATVKRLMENAGNATPENLSLAECAGILRVYIEMYPLSKALAAHLEPVLPACIEKLEKSCKMEGDNLTISENGTFLSVLQAIEIGDAILRYGEFISNQNLISGGKYLICSYLGESSSFDLRTLSELYPIIVHDNTFYPHFVKLYTENDNVVWAWTSARAITYEKGSDKSLSLYIDFPQDYTHYVIFRGIPAFRNILIYDVQFRTDPRFETYNSSGYVYKTDTKALLLKSRHKSEKETIRLGYAAPVVEEKPKIPEPEPVPEPQPEVQEEVEIEPPPAEEAVITPEPEPEPIPEPVSEPEPAPAAKGKKKKR